jgi:hypothetical protein
VDVPLSRRRPHEGRHANSVQSPRFRRGEDSVGERRKREFHAALA